MFLFIIILVFYFFTFNYYSSNKNLQSKDFNRNNIEKIINNKIADLPILTNDTNNVVEFNDSFSDEINNKKSRSFWNLLESK